MDRDLYALSSDVESNTLKTKSQLDLLSQQYHLKLSNIKVREILNTQRSQNEQIIQEIERATEFDFTPVNPLR